RELVYLNLNKDIKETLNSSSIREWFFGGDFGERSKTRKILGRSGQELRAPLVRSKVTRKLLAAKSLNYKSPPRTPALRCRQEISGSSKGRNSSQEDREILTNT
ncbi:hypothetical protein ILUMI_21509, partial [Ignelater luminosus]